MSPVALGYYLLKRSSKELEVSVDFESINILRPKLEKEAESFFARYRSIDHPEVGVKSDGD